jgi:ATP-binding cassette subfamily B protein RaxB
MKNTQHLQQSTDRSERPNIQLSKFEKYLLERAWPFAPKSKVRFQTDMGLLRDSILSFFGCTNQDALSAPLSLSALLKELREEYGIVDISLGNSQNSMRGDSGLLLCCQKEGIEIIYPDRFRRHKNSRNDNSQLVMLIHTLPVKPVGVITLMRRILTGRFLQLLIIAVIALIAVLISLGPTWLQAYIFNNVVPSGQKYLMVQIAAFLLCLKLTTNSLKAFNQFVGLRLELFLGLTTTALLVHRLLISPVSLFSKYNVGDLQQRVNSAHAVRRALQQSFVTVITAIFIILLNITLIFFQTHSIELCLLLLAATAIGPFFDSIMAVIESILRIRKLNFSGNMQDAILFPLESLQTVRSLAIEGEVFEKFSDLRYRIARLVIKIGLLKTTLRALTLSLNAAVISLLLYMISSPSALSMLGVATDTNGTMPSQGIVILLLSAFSTINAAVRSLSTSLLTLVKVIPDAIRFRPILQTTPVNEKYVQLAAKKIVSIQINTLKTQRNSGLSLQNLEINQDKSVALISGDSDLSTQILRFLAGQNPERLRTQVSLQILINGQYFINEVDLPAYRQRIELVGTIPMLLAGTIKENITDYSTSSDQEWLENCLTICKLPNDQKWMNRRIQTGYISTKGSVIKVSTQILLARALYRKPDAIFIDRAFDDLPHELTKNIVLHCMESKIILAVTTNNQDVADLLSLKVSLDLNSTRS